MLTSVYKKGVIRIHTPICLYIHREMLEVCIRTVVISRAGEGTEQMGNKGGREIFH